jgi:transitional endoplasmic reticulum ATPase
VSVPRLPGLEITLCDWHPCPEYGTVFELHVQGPRKYTAEVEKIFEEVEAELRTNSIYRGKALTGSDKLEFFDLSTFDASQIVFSDLVWRTLNAKLWSVLRYPEAVRAQGVPLKRAVLLYGPYGTGKTSAGLITGQIATANGWTFLSARTGDDIEDVLRTARLYQKAVVFFEDIDREADNDASGLAELLDAFDGATSKGGELIVVMTTNHYQNIPKGMLRPGRLDSVIKIAELDRGGTERLIKALVPAGKLSPDVDYGEVFAAMDGYLPAFVREAVSSAVLFALNRLGGDDNYVIATEDLVNSAESLRDQFDAHNDAADGTHRPNLGQAMTDTVRAALHNGVLNSPRLGRATFVLDGTPADRD